jgi:hypothetical protein
MPGQCNLGETDRWSRKRGSLSIQGHNTGCSGSDPSTAQGAMHQGRGVPTMPSCQRLHRLLPWYQVGPRGINSSCTVF